MCRNHCGFTGYHAILEIIGKFVYRKRDVFLEWCNISDWTDLRFIQMRLVSVINSDFKALVELQMEFVFKFMCPFVD